MFAPGTDNRRLGVFGGQYIDLDTEDAGEWSPEENLGEELPTENEAEVGVL